MKSTTLIGIVLLVLGALALVAPIPHHESRGVKIDNTKVSIQTETRDKMPPAVGIVFITANRTEYVRRKETAVRTLKCVRRSVRPRGGSQH